MNQTPVESSRPFEPFVPAWWCRGGNAQTIWAAVLRLPQPLPVARERWETPDGDFLDVDRVSGASGTPVVVVLHGLESHSRTPQMRGFLRAARRLGWHGLALNFRSCSGESNRLERSYHAGDTADVAWVIRRVAAQCPGQPVCCVGLSLGANVLLKYLGEQGDAVPQVAAAAAVSAPFDLGDSARAFESGFWPRVYMHRLVTSLKRKTRGKLRRYPQLIDQRQLARIRTIAEFDERVTAPLNGFGTAQRYWAAASCVPFLETIRRPTLLISAQDDPVVPARAWPVQAIARNPWLTGAFPKGGGHVGFIGGAWPGQSEYWAERVVFEFFRRRLARPSVHVDALAPPASRVP